MAQWAVLISSVNVSKLCRAEYRRASVAIEFLADLLEKIVIKLLYSPARHSCE